LLKAPAAQGLARVGLINRAVDLAITPTSDEAQWGVVDHWSPPFETLQTHRGDCEDYAIVKYVALLQAGPVQRRCEDRHLAKPPAEGRPCGRSRACGLKLPSERDEKSSARADCKLQDASRALKQAQLRIEAAEDQLTAAEFRAQAAEAEARETKQALALVEEAIRRRLPFDQPQKLIAG